MEVSKKCMMPFKGQMSVGEFRADVTEFQVFGVPSRQDEPEIWHFLAQRSPSPLDFCHQTTHGTGKQRGGGVAANPCGLTQRRSDGHQVWLRQTSRALCHGGQSHLESW